MIRQLKITALLTAALLTTACGLKQTSSEMAASDYQSTNSIFDCDFGPFCAFTEKPPKAIYFDFGTSVLDMEDRKLLDTVAEHMGDSRRIELTGYTCKIGSNRANQNLSESRALAVKAYLMHKGIEEERITTSGKGKHSPATLNSKGSDRSQNRRVEMRIFR
ncbi:OmpA family protein [Endozoicomonas sp. GU-1]|uniref:OmpA family protein n=1 Tax=Endozoicomonas sp. GU-1 TaxID=3009078 RepID=UPI0022B5E1F8|nr:OmpA family protein [Endozoicomonas sp. GU-1]WBA83124.1 OmpA family protein [Endozoicomonas sp. GU-1]WBA86048.1 OmpA family protein [Endozoicomonas sp. GU-1]